MNKTNNKTPKFTWVQPKELLVTPELLTTLTPEQVYSLKKRSEREQLRQWDSFIKRQKQINQALSLPKKKPKQKHKKKFKSHPEKKPLSYKEYMKSYLWEDRKTKYFSEFDRKCVKCGSLEKIHLHHIAYYHEEFGKEKNEDLAALCETHHDEFHKTHGVHQNMHKIFEYWLST